jgi:hypothetical protein
MRTPTWFRPARDLRPVLARFNAESSGTAAEAADAARRIGKEIREYSSKRGEPLHREASRSLVRRLTHRIHLGTFVKFEICNALVIHAGTHDITMEAARWAWFDLWTCLQSWCPSLPQHIRRCPWCGRLFWAARAHDKVCSVVCGRVDQLLRGAEEVLAKIVTNEMAHVDAVRRRSQKQYGDFDARAEGHYQTLLETLIAPMMRPLADRFEQPTDPTAFLVVWGFVFNEPWGMIDRAFRCPECGKCGFRRDLRMKYCSRQCQMVAHSSARAESQYLRNAHVPSIPSSFPALRRM